jgi:hypothetical protein
LHSFDEAFWNDYLGIGGFGAIPYIP